MSPAPAVRVEGVAKKFARSLDRSMYYGLADLGRDLIGLPAPDRLRPGEFWAVDDVSFEVNPGECVGLIGPNGAGKSTLLKMINGIIPPDRGRIELRGRVGTLIEIGAGFHPLLTGRENIFINGALLGMSRAEAASRLDEIVAFADVGDFIDSPVKFYSSGMYVRLGFAIAIHFNPDILLVDEVLSVGDLNFRVKCLERIRRLIGQGAAIIIISHNLHIIRAVCHRAGALDHGRLVIPFEDPGQALEKSYPILARENARPGGARQTTEAAALEGPVAIDGVRLLDAEGREKEVFQFDETFRVRVDFTAHQKIENPSFGVEIKRTDGLVCIMSRSSSDGFAVPAILGKGSFEMEVKGLRLAPLVYTVRAVINDGFLTVPLAIAFGPEFTMTSSKPYAAGVFSPEVIWKVAP